MRARDSKAWVQFQHVPLSSPPPPSWHPRSLRNPPCTPEPDARPPSFPFQWLWDPSAAGGRGLLLSPPHSPNPHRSPTRLPDQGGRSQGARGRKGGDETFKGGRNRGGRRPQGCGYRGAGSPQGSRGPSSCPQHHPASLSQHLLAEGGAWPRSPRSRRRRGAPPAPPRSVPDFTALHRNIQEQLEQRKTKGESCGWLWGGHGLVITGCSWHWGVHRVGITAPPFAPQPS